MAKPNITAVTIGTDVWYFDDSFTRSDIPRAAKVTGPGSNPGTVNITVFHEPSLDVKARGMIGAVVRTNVPLYDRHPRHMRVLRFCVYPPTQSADLEGNALVTPFAGRIQYLPATPEGDAGDNDGGREPGDDPVKTEPAKTEPPKEPASLDPVAHAFRQLRKTGPWQGVIEPLLERGAVEREANGRLTISSIGSKVQLVTFQFLTREPKGFRLRAYMGGSNMKVVRSGVLDVGDVNRLVRLAGRIVDAGLEAKTKADAARAGQAGTRATEPRE